MSSIHHSHHGRKPMGLVELHEIIAALRSISFRFFALSLAALALPPFAPPSLPSAAAWRFFSVLVSSISPVAIFGDHDGGADHVGGALLTSGASGHALFRQRFRNEGESIVNRCNLVL
jgi:hypothetical protein